jgi:hypothetical protein
VLVTTGHEYIYFKSINGCVCLSITGRKIKGPGGFADWEISTII